MDTEDIQSSQEGSLESSQESSFNLEEVNNNDSSSVADTRELQTFDLKTKENEAFQTKNETGFDNDLKQIDKSEKMFGSEIDKDFYNEILEKLDIKPKNKEQDIQENQKQVKLMQEKLKQDEYLNKISDLEKIQTKIQVEKAISQDFSKIEKLMKAGLINSGQGQNLKKQVLKKAFDSLVQTEKVKRGLTTASNNNLRPNVTANKNEVFEQFSKSNPNFFTSDGRNEVLNYLKSNDVIIGKNELNKISQMVRTVEKAAIDRYLQKVAHEKTLRDSNETAKQKLTANAQKSGLSGNLSRTFTREQIGKMTGAEFTKYESAIMEQLKKGLIK